MGIVWSCKDTPNVKHPSFDKALAYSMVKKQLSFGTRVPGSQSHAACKDWLVSQFKEFGAEVHEQNFQAKTFDGKSLNSINIIASYNPTSKYRIIIAAHWDTRPFSDHDPDTSMYNKPIMGADDGASGVAVALAMAKAIQSQPMNKYGIDFILFDAEDYGDDHVETMDDLKTWCLGSQYWSANPHIPAYKADYGILLDMVGAKDPRFTQDEISVHYAPRVLQKVWKIAHDLGYNKFFLNDKTSGITDDHQFVNEIARIPMIDILNRPLGTKYGFVHHHHTQKDDLPIIEPNSLDMVGSVLIKLIYLEDKDKI